MVPDWKANTVLISDTLSSRHPEIVRQLECILRENGVPRVIVSSYGMPEDVEAVQKLNRLCPEATVVSVPCLNLAREGGVLQCVSWTVRVMEPDN